MAIHLRDLLITHGILTPIDRHTAAFEDWLAAHLPRHPPETQQLLHGFATWHHLRRIRQSAAAGTLTPGTIRTTEQEITVAGQLLTHLHPKASQPETSNKPTSTPGWPAAHPPATPPGRSSAGP